MSDSEDNFASADEGDLPDKPKQGEKSGQPKQKEDNATKDSKPEKAETDSQQQASGGAVPKQETGTKGNKNKKQQKKKGKDSGKAAKEKNAAKTESSASDNVKQADTQKDKGAGKQGKNGAKKPPSASNVDAKKEPNKDSNSEGTKQSNEDNKVQPTESQTNTDSITEKKDSVNSAPKDSITESDKSDKAKKESEEVLESKDTAGDSKQSEESVVKTPVKTGDSSQTTSSESGSKEAGMLKSPSSQNIMRPGPDHTSEQEDVLSKLADAATEKKSGWGWGWGSSLLTAASSSVSTFTNQVGEGFHTMIESVESTLNVPDPEEMAKTSAEIEKIEGKTTETSDSDKPETESEKTLSAEDQQKQEVETESVKEPAEKEAATGNQAGGGDSDSWFSSWGVSNITNITKMVENTSKTLVTGGLDVLETIGKKTFEVINEHDPGLKKTLGLVKNRGDKPNLSAMLRDAKEHHEAMVEQEKECEEARKSHFGALFDDFQGLAHLEALEMLSNQSEKQVNTLLGALSPDQVGSMKPQLLQIKGHFEIEEDEEEVQEQDFSKLVTDTLAQLNVSNSPDKLIKTQEKICDTLSSLQGSEDGKDMPQTKEIHQSAIQSLAEFTSKSIEYYHKFGELILLHKAKMAEFVTSSQQLHSLTKVLCAEVGIVSTKYSETLNKCEGGEETLSVNQLVTNVYLEASNSCSYIQDGFQLLLPVMQQAAMEQCQTAE